MGKANRVKSRRENAASAKTVKKEKKSGILMTVALSLVVVMIVAVFAGWAGSQVYSKYESWSMSKADAIYTENYKITSSMLQYMFMSDYQEFVNSYSYYVSMFGLDTTKPLDEQEFSDTAASFLGSFDGTWKDYFMSSIKTQTEQMLLYCEVADEKGITLDEDELAVIDEAIHELEHSASNYGYASLSTFLTANYGKGVKESDIREVYRLSSLASKVAEVIDAELMDGITEDEINTKYEASKKEYNVKDYVFYTISVDYENVLLELYPDYDGKTELTETQKTDALEAYKSKISEAKNKAEAFESYTTVEEFKKAVLEDLAYDGFESFYKTEALADADKLSDADLHTVKVALIEAVIDEVMAGAEMADATTEADGVFTAYDVTLTENAAKAIDNIKKKVYDNLTSAKGYYFDLKFNYDSADSIPKWAFDEAKIGDTKTLSYGDGSSEGDIENEAGYFDIGVYMVASDEYKDETLAKNIAYMTFSTELAAKKAIESFNTSATKDLAAFEAVAKSTSAAMNGTFENYLEGQLSYGTYETWLYDDATVIGSITETPIADSATSPTEYAVFFYYADGDAAWYIDVQNAIFVEDYQEYYNGISAKFPVTVVEEELARVGN